MTTLVLDTGALISLDRNERDTWALLSITVGAGDHVTVPAGVIAQAWRDGRRQARLAQALHHCDEIALDGTHARAVGLLCAATDTSDIVDASVAVAAAALARHQPTILLTSDVDDLQPLLDELGSAARIEPV